MAYQLSAQNEASAADEPIRFDNDKVKLGEPERAALFPRSGVFAAVGRMAALNAGLGRQRGVFRESPLGGIYGLPTLAARGRSEGGVLGEAAPFCRDGLSALPSDRALLLRIHRSESALAFGLLFH